MAVACSEAGVCRQAPSCLLLLGPVRSGCLSCPSSSLLPPARCLCRASFSGSPGPPSTVTFLLCLPPVPVASRRACKASLSPQPEPGAWAPSEEGPTSWIPWREGNCVHVSVSSRVAFAALPLNSSGQRSRKEESKNLAFAHLCFSLLSSAHGNDGQCLVRAVVCILSTRAFTQKPLREERLC